MTKYITLIFSFLLLQSFAFAQNSNEFEAELRLLENPESMNNDFPMQKVESINKDQGSVIEDTVKSGLAAPTRPDLEADKVVPTSKKTRRIPSR